MELPKRKPSRLSYYDYSTPGAYFITICTKDKKCILGKIVGGGALDAPIVQLTEMGHVVQQYILSGNNVPGVTVDKFVIVPNHIHLVLLLAATHGTSRAPSPTNAVVPHFVSTLKRFCNRDVGRNIFQRSFHDHIIRGEKDYQKILEYIENNPIHWKEDCFCAEEII